MKNFHGGEIYDKMISCDFSVNTNPLGMQEEVKTALVNNLNQFELYPDIKCRDLIKSIQEYYRIENEKSILVGNGASELIMALATALLPEKALVTAPTFSGYERGLQAWECEIKYHTLLPENDFEVTNSLIDSAKDCDIIFLCNPNNPTGKLIKTSVLEEIIDFCEAEEKFLVIDESFIELSLGENAVSIMRYAQESELIISLMSLTKTYSLAGLRAGFIVSGSHDLLDRMREVMPEWSVSIPGQIAANIAISNKEKYLCDSIDIIEKEKEYLSDALAKKGYKVYPSDTNFILFEGPEDLYKKLLEKNILIRDCSNYIGLSKGYYRICVSTHDKNEKLISLL